MKTSFNIIPDQENLHILAESSAHGFDFIYFEKNPFIVHGITSYQYNRNQVPQEIQANLDRIVAENENWFKTAGSLTIMHDEKESSLVPHTHVDNETRAALLNLVYGENENSLVYDDVVLPGLKNIYRLQNRVAGSLKRHFAQADMVHANSLLIKAIGLERDALHCIFSHHQLKVIFILKGGLQLAQSYQYGTAADALYLLMGICQSYQVNPSEIPLVVYGLIDEKSNLYAELHKYFLHLAPAILPKEVQLSQDMVQYPAHYFCHLVMAATCVL